MSALLIAAAALSVPLHDGNLTVSKPFKLLKVNLTREGWQPKKLGTFCLSARTQVIAVSHRPEFQRLADRTLKLAKPGEHTVAL